MRALSDKIVVVHEVPRWHVRGLCRDEDMRMTIASEVGSSRRVGCVGTIYEGAKRRVGHKARR